MSHGPIKQGLDGVVQPDLLHICLDIPGVLLQQNPMAPFYAHRTGQIFGHRLKAPASRLATIFLALYACLLSPTSKGKIIYVNGDAFASGDGQSWSTPLLILRQATLVATNGDEIWAAAVTNQLHGYFGPITPREGVALYGGFLGTEANRDERDWLKNPTRLAGTSTGDAAVNGPDGGVTPIRVDGFVLSTTSGSGVVCSNSALILANCTIVSNNLSGAVFCQRSFVVITNNLVAYNFKYGPTTTISPAITLWGCQGTVAGNTICSNRVAGLQQLAFGGGLDIEDTGPGSTNIVTVLNNTITGNSAYSGGGIEAYLSSPLIASNLVLYNTAVMGAGIDCVSAPAQIIGNRIIGNSVSGRSATGGGPIAGGGINVWGSPPSERLIANNLIVSNTVATNAMFGGGGIYCYQGTTPLIINNSLLHNVAATGGGIQCDSTGARLLNNLIAFGNNGLRGAPGLSLSNNCVFGNTNGNYSGLTDPTGTNGNISADPLLAESAGRARFLPGSPCIDAGDDALVQPDWLDLEGQTRLAGAHVDIGCYESGHPGVWEPALADANLVALGVPTVGGITYAQLQVTLTNSCWRIFALDSLEQQGTNFSQDLKLETLTGGDCVGATNTIERVAVLGNLLPGDYAFALLSWDRPVQSQLFSAPSDKTPTISAANLETNGSFKLRVEGLPGVAYLVQASTNLTSWSALATNIGAPFDFLDAASSQFQQRFYRTLIGVP